MKNLGGSIFEDKKSGRWIYKSSPDKAGKRSRKSFKTREEAEAYRTYVCINIGLEVNTAAQMTFSDAYEKWARLTWGNEDYISNSTSRGFHGYYQKHILPILGEQILTNLNFVPLCKYFLTLAEDGLSNKTLRNIKQSVVMFLQYAAENNWCQYYDSDLIKIPKTQKRNREKVVNTISQKEFDEVIKKVRENADPEKSYVEAVLLFLRYSGIRIEELCITTKDINFSKKYILINKAVKRTVDPITKKSTLQISKYLKSDAAYRKIPLSPNIMESLTLMDMFKYNHKIESSYIFCSKRGTIIDPRTVLRTYHNYLKMCGLRIRGLHSMRKLFCKETKDKGIEWEVLRRLMGHENVDITKNTYYNLSDDDYVELAGII